MLPYKSLIQLKRNSAIALHIQICNNFITLITNGTLQPTGILPSSRVLADLISVNRKTVKLAYQELISQGWAESVERKGIFVFSSLPVLPEIESIPVTGDSEPKESFLWTNHFQNTHRSESYQKLILTIDDGFPDVRLTPVDQLMREYRSISKRFYGKNFLKYGDSKGSEHLRTALAFYLGNTRGLIVSPENILITKGSHGNLFVSTTFTSIIR